MFLFRLRSCLVLGMQTVIVAKNDLSLTSGLDVVCSGCTYFDHGFFGGRSYCTNVQLQKRAGNSHCKLAYHIFEIEESKRKRRRREERKRRNWQAAGIEFTAAAPSQSARLDVCRWDHSAGSYSLHFSFLPRQWKRKKSWRGTMQKAQP